MRVIVTIDGDLLVPQNPSLGIAGQREEITRVVRSIGELLLSPHELVLTHGNAPQVGFVLLRAELASHIVHSLPLDVCGADTQGAIGYELQQALQNQLYHRKVHKNVATIITQILVDQHDPAFASPSKPIGGFMDAAEAERRRKESGWSVVEDAGRGWRRVVASPMPKEIVELDSIKAVLHDGITVITAGGGGIPVVDVGGGEYRGVAAVIDKDYACSLLAREVKADLFLIATAVEKVAINFGTPRQQWLDRITLAEAKRYLAEGTHFAKGSMAPKIQAIIWYLEAGGREALITNPENIGRALRGETGTRITA